MSKEEQLQQTSGFEMDGPLQDEHRQGAGRGGMPGLGELTEPWPPERPRGLGCGADQPRGPED